MFLGIGVDLVAIKRIKNILNRFPDRFLDRIFTEREKQNFLEYKGSAASLAARFAAKEAALKAIGCGIGPAALKEVEIIIMPGKEPAVKLHGEASRLARNKQITAVAVSLTHEPPFACAVAAAYSGPDPSTGPGLND